MMSKIFGGKDPFDDPFFTQPFGGIFGYNPFENKGGSKKQITIEELNPEDDGDPVAKSHVPDNEIMLQKNKPYVDSGTQHFSFRRVSYGGINGTYYTCSEGKMAGDDGVVLMETKEDDKMLGQTLHTISRGIGNKGHSVTTQQHSDGRVDSLQTLHNLNEDELTAFEDNWRSNADKHFTGWKEGFSLLENAGSSSGSIWDDFANWNPWSGLDSWALPPLEHFENAGALIPDAGASNPTSGTKSKRVVPVD